MKAEQILEVLMDDKKYKAKVEELKALDARLSESRRIADTVEKAEKMAYDLDVKLMEVAQEKENIAEREQARMVEMRDELKKQKEALDLRAAKEREQYMVVRDMLAEIKVVKDEVTKKQLANAQQVDILKKWEAELLLREQTLANKLKRVNEAFNG